MNRLCLLIAILGFITSPASSSDSCSTPPAAQTSATATHESPLACDRLALSATERKRHFDELGPMLIRLKTGVHELANGYELEFPSDAKTFALVAEWVEQERRCCPFFDIDVRINREGGPLSLRLTGRKGTKEFIEADGKDWIRK
ncbi:MAG TPA: hypothetical protein VNN08_00735 [Thermoanaerobaculia bacterium]|nr:hypothetical protein [Thermoanaerobaculia bacterium]